LAEPPPNAERDQRLDPVIAEYLEAVERAGISDPTPWLERYPDLADELLAFFTAEVRFGRLVAPLRNSLPPTPAAGAEPPPLRTVQDYELLSELGRGGMGVVYKARQRSLNRLVAVKMIRSAEWATAQERLRFRFEAETVAKLFGPETACLCGADATLDEVSAAMKAVDYLHFAGHAQGQELQRAPREQRPGRLGIDRRGRRSGVALARGRDEGVRARVPGQLAQADTGERDAGRVPGGAGHRPRALTQVLRPCPLSGRSVAITCRVS
jgi:hypothetical protein